MGMIEICGWAIDPGSVAAIGPAHCSSEGEGGFSVELKSGQTLRLSMDLDPSPAPADVKVDPQSDGSTMIRTRWGNQSLPQTMSASIMTNEELMRIVRSVSKRLWSECQRSKVAAARADLITAASQH